MLQGFHTSTADLGTVVAGVSDVYQQQQRAKGTTLITRRILVVDDEETVCLSVKKVLGRKGYAVDIVLSADEAIKKIDNEPFDVVITDLMMPKTSGMELLQIIRDRYPELEVIMITGYASIETAVKATKLGAINYLPKPFTPEELSAATEKAIANRTNRSSGPSKTSAAKLPVNDMIDVDMPFSEAEVAIHTSKKYVESLTHSDIPLAKKVAEKAYCKLGNRDCRRVVVENRECVDDECPIEKKEKARAKIAHRPLRRSAEIIDVDMPFSISEVEQYVGSHYVNCMSRSDIPIVALFGRDATAKHSVLVVDDEPIVCHSVRRILAKKSCAVEEAFDVDAALHKLKINKYDLVILDLKMPKRSGLEVLNSIRKNWPNIPVVMISGFASIESAIEATKAGAYDFVPKPFTPAELTKVADQVLVG